jgi:F-type H+-transporting ATPase subunit a
VTTAATPERRFGFKRWIVLGCIILGAYLQFGPLPVVTPNVFLPGEPLPINLPILNQPLTNTLLATLLTDILVLALGFFIWRKASSGDLVPRGFYNAVEALFEFLWNTAVTTAGRKNARKFIPFMATIFFMVLFANWMELIPGVDSVGVLEPAHGTFTGYEARPLGGLGYWLDGRHELPHDEGSDHHGLCHSCTVTPFVRAAATDLNFTLALALISVFMTQVFGFAAQKMGHVTKFLNFKALVTVPVWGAMDFAVGLLELISEFAKILSFTFRLFGNIFAGQLLLFILGSLVSFVVPTGLYLFEIFVGLIQAYIFAMLTLVFMSQATEAHGAEAH